MAEEHITTVEPADGTRGGTTHTTIVHDSDSRSGGAGWFIGLVLLVAVIAGFYFFTQTSSSEAVKDNAIANAANQVGDAAQQAGNAVEGAAERVAPAN
ncbi:MAG TPA: hypothetical protein VJM34_12275 [Novosphingobium sp.]|nr:hypothetical protein [Novosphingobium sp.]